jgi:hypothetical protein
MSIFFRPLGAACLISSVMIASTAQSDLRVSFDEGAPKDRFRIENTSACAVTDTSINIDLSASNGGLIFDVTSRGDGVEVFQPFELVEGTDALKAVPTVADGQTDVRLDIVRLAPNEAIAFTIDVDDTRGQRAITVSGPEIEGAVVTYSHAQVQKTATFSALSTAVIQISNC